MHGNTRWKLLVLALASVLSVASCALAEQEGTQSLLIRGATVVDPSAGTVLENHCIWIAGERIDRIAPCEQRATAARVIEAGGNWVIPGLWDMHVHAVWDESVFRDFFADFVAYGVVGVRDMGGNPTVLAAAREFLSQDGNIGPELIAAGKILDGPSPVHPGISLAISTADEGRQAVADVAAMGADFIKVYTTLPQAAANAVFDEAGKRGMKVAGHLPYAIELSDAIDGGMASIEHMAVELGGLCDVDDYAACSKTFTQIRSAGVYLTPTLVVRERAGSMGDPEIVDLSRITSMPDVLAKEWAAQLEQNRKTKTTAYFEEKAQQFVRERQLTEIAIKLDSLILVGTDSGVALVPPGSSIHEELEFLVSAGMDEMTALYSATGRAADFLKLGDRGRIRAGSIADLVILNSNPLDDIRNTRDIESVIVKGNVLDKGRLSCLKLRTECE